MSPTAPDATATGDERGMQYPSAPEAAVRLLPLLREYSAKLAAIAETGPAVLERLALQNREAKAPAALDAGRLICLHDTLAEPVTNLAREASGLIEHGALDHQLRSELKLRLDELEEHLRYASVLVGELTERVARNKTQVEWIRKLIEKSGRYKAPF
jgi:hypothetical protein